MSNTMKNAIVTPILMMVVMTVLLGVLYPLVITALGAVVFPSQAGGSLVNVNGQVIGSSLLAQPFSDDKYFWPRPSAVNYGIAVDSNGKPILDSDGNPTLGASGGSNLGPTSATLAQQIKDRATAIRKANDLPDDASIPADLLTASASGLDPQISPAAAQLQVARIAQARGLSADKVSALVNELTEGPQFGIFGQPRVNVLLLNIALDELK